MRNTSIYEYSRDFFFFNPNAHSPFFFFCSGVQACSLYNKKSRIHIEDYFALNSQYAHTGRNRLDRSWPYTSKVRYLRQHINCFLVEKYIHIVFQMKI